MAHETSNDINTDFTILRLCLVNVRNRSVYLRGGNFVKPSDPAVKMPIQLTVLVLEKMSFTISHTNSGEMCIRDRSHTFHYENGGSATCKPNSQTFYYEIGASATCKPNSQTVHYEIVG